jgi:hypothetical protein
MAGEVGLVVAADGRGHLGGRGALQQQSACSIDPAADYVRMRA